MTCLVPLKMLKQTSLKEKADWEWKGSDTCYFDYWLLWNITAVFNKMFVIHELHTSGIMNNISNTWLCDLQWIFSNHALSCDDMTLQAFLEAKRFIFWITFNCITCILFGDFMSSTSTRVFWCHQSYRYFLIVLWLSGFKMKFSLEMWQCVFEVCN